MADPRHAHPCWATARLTYCVYCLAKSGLHTSSPTLLVPPRHQAADNEDHKHAHGGVRGLGAPVQGVVPHHRVLRRPPCQAQCAPHPQPGHLLLAAGGHQGDSPSLHSPVDVLLSGSPCLTSQAEGATAPPSTSRSDRSMGPNNAVVGHAVSETHSWPMVRVCRRSTSATW